MCSCERQVDENLEDRFDLRSENESAEEFTAGNGNARAHKQSELLNKMRWASGQEQSGGAFKCAVEDSESKKVMIRNKKAPLPVLLNQ